MKKLFSMMLVLTLCYSAAPVLAIEDPVMTAESGYQEVSNDSLWNKITDYIATIGKSDSEKARILAERRSERNAKRQKKQITG